MAQLTLGKLYATPALGNKQGHYPHRQDGYDTDIGWCGRALTTLEHEPAEYAGKQICNTCKRKETEWSNT